MKVEVEDVSKVEKRLDIEVPAEQVDDQIEEQFNEFKNKAQVPGFRAGKAPRKVLERRFGKYINELVIEELIKQTLETALSRKSIEPVVEPVVDRSELTPGEPYRYTVHVEVKPAVELKEYKGLLVRQERQEIGDEQVEGALESMREAVALIREPEEERPIQKTDLVTVEMTAREGDVEIDLGGAEQEIPMWRKSWIEGIADRLAGKNKGDGLTLSVEIGANDQLAPEAARGKRLDLSITVKEVKERVLSELNDDFAKEYTKSETLEQLRDSTRRMLQERVDQRNKDQLHGSLLEVLVEKNPVEVPPSLVRMEAQRMAVDFMMRNFRKRPDPEEVTHFSSYFETDARRMFEINYLLEAVAGEEKIEVTEEEVDKVLAEEAERAGMHPDKLKARLSESELSALKGRLRLEKSLDFLVSEATITDEGKDHGDKNEK